MIMQQRLPAPRKKFDGVWYKLHAFTNKKSHAQTIRNQLKNHIPSRSVRIVSYMGTSALWGTPRKMWAVYTFGGSKI